MRPALIVLTTAALAACPGEPIVTSDPGSSGEPETTDPSTSTATGETPTSTAVTSTSDDPASTSSSSDATTSTATGDASSSTGPGLDDCPTFLCGAPVVCCAADSDCVAGECVSACASGVRCGADQTTCCAAGEACVGDTCTARTGACTSSADCDELSHCDPVLAQCLPDADPPTCTPPKIEAAVELAWEFTTDEVTTMPVVVDLDGDGNPEVVVNTMRAKDKPADYSSGELVCLDGTTGEELWRISQDPVNGKHGPNGRTTLAVGDVDGDDHPDIIYPGRPEGPSSVSPIYAVDGDGKLLWTSHDKNDVVAKIRVQNAAPALANLDDDPQTEIAYGAALYDHDGLLVWNQNGSGAVVGSPHSKNMPNQLLNPGGLPTFADLTGDGYPELITGREAWTVDWTPGDPPTVALNLHWKDTSGTGGDGWPAVADLDNNGSPEVVLVAWPEIKILDGKTGNLWCGADPTGVACSNAPAKRTQPLTIPGGNIGGPATIADFDGDGRLEFGLTTGSDYRVFDLHRPNEVIHQPDGDPVPGAGAIFTRWRVPVQDQSSGSTGSSAFDLDADGASEVLYQDECRVRIFDGSSGDVLLDLTSSSGTIHEYPVVSDVDDDGRTDLLVVANLSDAGINDKCLAADPTWKNRKGVYLYRPTSTWAPTTSPWTMHSHHVTNADPSGNVPLSEQDNWKVPGLNNFREAPAGEVLHVAPDLTASLAVDLALCPDQLILRAKIFNNGALGLPAGQGVTFFAGSDELGPEIATVETSELVGPGGSTVVETTIPAPDGPADYFVLVDPAAQTPECREDNNGALAGGAACGR